MLKYTVTITETIEYKFDVEAMSARSAVRQVREKFLAMNANEQFANSTGITDRTFESVTDMPEEEGAEQEFFDDDEFQYGDEEFA